jgi:hypothetical protein
MVYTSHVVAALISIREVPGSNVDPETFCIDRYFSWIFSDVSGRQTPGFYLKLDP